MVKISFEATPRSRVSQQVLDKVDAVSVTHLPNDSFAATVDGVKRINDVAGRRIAFPHIAARNLHSVSELIEGIQDLNNESQQALLIGGAGDNWIYRDKLDVYYDLQENLALNWKFYIGVDPNLDETKRLKSITYLRVGDISYGMNQLCLNPERMRWWRNFIIPCLPTQTTAKGLWKYMKLCGVTTSLKGLWINKSGINYIHNGRIDVNRFWRDTDYGSERERVHFFNFGNLERTIDGFQQEFGTSA